MKPIDQLTNQMTVVMNRSGETQIRDIPKQMHELSSADEIVVHCRSGVRSAKAVELLMKAGFRKIHNLKGGVLAWADQVDRSLPKY